MKSVINYLLHEDGASAGEYALILAIIGTAVAAASFTLGDNIKTGMGLIGGCIAAPTTKVDATGCK